MPEPGTPRFGWRGWLGLMCLLAVVGAIINAIDGDSDRSRNDAPSREVPEVPVTAMDPKVSQMAIRIQSVTCQLYREGRSDSEIAALISYADVDFKTKQSLAAAIGLAKLKC